MVKQANETGYKLNLIAFYNRFFELVVIQARKIPEEKKDMKFLFNLNYIKISLIYE
jgi:hypothetical protein